MFFKIKFDYDLEYEKIAIFWAQNLTQYSSRYDTEGKISIVGCGPKKVFILKIEMKSFNKFEFIALHCKLE